MDQETPEYRKYANPNGDGNHLLASQSVGCWLTGSQLRRTDDGNYEKVPSTDMITLEAYLKGLAHTMYPGKDIVEFKMSTKARFTDDLMVGKSSAFYIGDGLVATAGHCVFETAGKPSLQDGWADWYLVFGFTQAFAQAGASIPRSKVFQIKRVCFGQNERFEIDQFLTNEKADQPDWAIVRITPVYDAQPFPPALSILVPGAETDITNDMPRPDLWCAGHPWGTSLKISKQLEKDALLKYHKEIMVRGDIRQGIPYTYIWRHNLRINSGNSGGPLFRGTDVIGIIASGVNRNDKVGSAGFRIPPFNTDVIIPVDNNYNEATSNASRNELWYCLTTRQSRMFIFYQTREPLSGTLTVTFTLENLAGAVTKDIVLNLADTTSKGRILVDFGTAMPPGFLPCDLDSATLSWAGQQAIEFNFLSAGFWWTPASANGSEDWVPTTGCVLFRYTEPFTIKPQQADAGRRGRRGGGGDGGGGFVDQVFVARFGPFLSKDWKSKLSFGDWAQYMGAVTTKIA